MKRVSRSFVRPAAAFAVAAVLALFPAAVQAGEVAVTVSGGGVAEFLDPNPCDNFDTVGPFGFSNFSVGAQIDTEDNVTGHFICMVEDCFIVEGFYANILVVGQFTEVLDINDDGQQSVTLGGDAVLVLEGFGIADAFEFTVELREGPADVGGFTYTDYVTMMGPDDGSDSEVVRQGHVQIQFH